MTDKPDNARLTWIRAAWLAGMDIDEAVPALVGASDMELAAAMVAWSRLETLAQEAHKRAGIADGP